MRMAPGAWGGDLSPQSEQRRSTDPSPRRVGECGMGKNTGAARDQGEAETGSDANEGRILAKLLLEAPDHVGDHRAVVVGGSAAQSIDGGAARAHAVRTRLRLSSVGGSDGDQRHEAEDARHLPGSVRREQHRLGG